MTSFSTRPFSFSKCPKCYRTINGDVLVKITETLSHRQHGGIHFYKYQQKNFNGFLIQSVRLEENVSLFIYREDYETLKKAFESKEASEVGQHRLFLDILKDVEIGERLKHCFDKPDIKHYTYLAQLIEEVKISNKFSVYGVGLNLGQGKDHNNMVIKICRNDIGQSKYYENIPSEYKSQVYVVTLFVKSLILENISIGVEIILVTITQNG
jgi:hypothetical protein